MIEQLGIALAFSAFFTENKIGKTGLTVTCDVYRTNLAGVSSLVVNGGSAVPIGGGLYRYEMAAGLNTVEGEYHAIFKTTTSSVDQQHIPALWLVQKAGTENLDAPVSSRMATFVYTAPDNAAIIAINTRLPSDPADASDIAALFAGLPTSLGTGARTVTPTVLSPTLAPVEGAKIRYTKGGETYLGTTDVNGQVVSFNLDDGSWEVSITASGLKYNGTTEIVNGVETPIYEMELNTVVLPPLENYQVHVQAYVFDEFGQPEDGVEINVQMIQPSTLAGIFDKKVATFISVSGIVVFTNLFQGAAYNIWRGNSTPYRYYVPVVEEGVEVVDCDPILGDDEADPCV